MMERVISADGTVLAYSRHGGGPPVVLVGGGLDDGSENAPLAEALAPQFTVFNFARRGRGASGDGAGYAVEREIEDIAALIERAGGSAHLFGASSGGALALAAAAGRASVGRIAVYELPYDVAEGTAAQQRDYVAELERLIAAGYRDEALALFMRYAGSPEAQIEEARASPYWKPLKAIAHTLAYDAACLGDRTPPVALLAEVSQPALVLTGGSVPPFEAAADAVAAALPQGERRVLEDMGHVPNPARIAEVLTGFFADPR